MLILFNHTSLLRSSNLVSLCLTFCSSKAPCTWVYYKTKHIPKRKCPSEPFCVQSFFYHQILHDHIGLHVQCNTVVFRWLRKKLKRRPLAEACFSACVQGAYLFPFFGHTIFVQSFSRIRFSRHFLPVCIGLNHPVC